MNLVPSVVRGLSHEPGNPQVCVAFPVDCSPFLSAFLVFTYWIKTQTQGPEKDTALLFLNAQTCRHAQSVGGLFFILPLFLISRELSINIGGRVTGFPFDAKRPEVNCLFHHQGSQNARPLQAGRQYSFFGELPSAPAAVSQEVAGPSQLRAVGLIASREAGVGVSWHYS